MGPIDRLPEGEGIPPQNADSVMQRVRAQAEAETFQDTGPEGRGFLDGDHNLFGYNRVVVEGGKIVRLKSRSGLAPDLELGAEVTLKGDSDGYVPSGHKDGIRVRIIEFAEPFRNNSSDRIVRVSGRDLVGWIKPSNIAHQ